MYCVKITVLWGIYGQVNFFRLVDKSSSLSAAMASCIADCSRENQHRPGGYASCRGDQKTAAGNL